jgi:hypothetical protein
MKIVFISYVDTLWAPEKEKIENPKRFVLLFAPIFRNMSETLPNPLPKIELEPYVLNVSENPRTLYEAFLHLQKWQEIFPGDTISFEYHFWRHQTYDFTGLQLARRMYEDARAYEQFNVSGIIQCASSKAFFPSGLAYYVYAKTLYDNSLSFDEIVEEYMFGIYGKDWKEVYEIFDKINDVFPFDYVTSSSAKRRPNGYVSAEMAEKISGIGKILDEEKKFVEEHYTGDRRVRTVAVRLLEKHIEFVSLMGGVFLAKAKGENELAKNLFNEARIAFGRHEPVIGKYFNHQQYFASLQHCASFVLEDVIFAV